VLDGLWNARVTSHISLAEVASHITRDRVLRALRLTDASMRTAGFKRPRIAVAGLNPHAGDGGNFGREEIDAIGPAVEQARADGVATEGPFPADTVFLRAKSGAFDAVLTMYHDQPGSTLSSGGRAMAPGFRRKMSINPEARSSRDR
jgi:4-hydroxythreonine-4-phosphate dehydrogenase